MTGRDETKLSRCRAACCTMASMTSLGLGQCSNETSASIVAFG
ncbi:Uncharacterised protein [Vibrio cholerae]|nr:Uncharacterised protein [Vibrio cholerae]